MNYGTPGDMVFSGDIGALMPEAGDDVSCVEWPNYGLLGGG